MPPTFFARDGHDNNFHLIRHLAAMAVVLTHSYSVVFGVYESEPLVAWFGTSIGHYAVDVFFVLSGFLIAQSLAANPDFLRFAVSRILRIFPALLITVAISSLVIGPLVTTAPLDGYFANPALGNYIAGALSTLQTGGPLPGVFAGQPDAGTVNMPLWTLKYEIAAYLSIAAVAALTLAFGRRAVLVAAGTIVIAYFASRYVLPAQIKETVIGNATHLLMTFYLGTGAYLARRHVPLTPLGIAGLAVLAAVTNGTLLGEFAEKMLIAYTVVWLAFAPIPAVRRLERFGDCSYGIYIYAYPIQQVLHLMYPGLAPAWLFAATLFATAPLALASWHLVERPSLAARGAITDLLRSHGRAAAAHS